ncbi:MAG: carbamate kinase [Actinomycetota bacterium]|nr:carbamate kinase [Actinomycetota bacterium]
MSVPRTSVLAFGGNALVPEGEAGTFGQQLENAAAMAGVVADLADRGDRLVVTHGNGPQVGSLAIQQEQGVDVTPAQPLFALGAMTQGQIGQLLGLALRNHRPAFPLPALALVTHVLVEPSDDAFDEPTKPIGPVFEEADAKRLADERGWQLVEDAGGGWRRVVASPEPVAIVEEGAVRTLVDAGALVIAGGGGGVPVVRRDDGRLEGVDAVIDKDLVAERLAATVGADALVLITNEDEVALDFGTSRQRPVHEMSVDEAEAHLADGQFPPGSMGPKVTAAVRFLRNGGQVAVITSPGHVVAALDGEHGTRVVPGGTP